MPRLRSLLLALAAVLALTAPGAASAAGTILVDTSPGTGAPPAALGPYAMTPFSLDAQPFGTVSGVAGPTGTVSFSPLLDHVAIGQGWQTWSHGYPGDVYATDGALSATLALPPGTAAFYLYAEPNPFQIVNITATAQDGTSSGPVAVDGFAGARYFGFYGTGGARIATITVSSPIDFAIGEFGISNGSSRNYVAFGDSYSSGEGVPPFFAGTDGDGDYCHRSPRAYSEVLGAIIGAAPRFYACSGAVTSDITTTVHYTEPPQLSRPGADATADLVTMTIGGNDAGFSGVLKTCISQKLKADAENAAAHTVFGPVSGWLGLDAEESCAKSDSFRSSVLTGIDNVFWPVKNTYLSILSQTSPTNTSIMVADYPRLFPSSHDAQDCLQLEPILTNDTQDFFNQAGDRLDDLLRQAAGEAGVNFVDVRGSFAGHEICGDDGSYVNALSTASGNAGACTLEVLGHCIIPGLPIVGSFHPNASGQGIGYAGAFASLINSATIRTPAGFPANPFPLPDPPSTTVVTAVGMGDLAAHAVTAGADDCSGTVQAGQQVQIDGDGFVPGAGVRVYVTSPGVSDTNELLVATLTADATGHVTGVVRIPLSATGFTPPGAAAGTAFIDAIGAGAAATHYDDVAMIGLAPHTSSCGTVETLPFSGFDPPVANLPAANPAHGGQSIPVKFSLPGATGSLADVLAPGYPQSEPVSCTDPVTATTGTPTSNVANPSGAPDYHYTWKTEKGWTGCRVLIVKLVDGSYHRALFNFGT